MRLSRSDCSAAGASSSAEQLVRPSPATVKRATKVVLPDGVMWGVLLVGCGHAGVVVIEFIEIAVAVFFDALVATFCVFHVFLAPAEQHDHGQGDSWEFTG